MARLFTPALATHRLMRPVIFLLVLIGLWAMLPGLEAVLGWGLDADTAGLLKRALTAGIWLALAFLLVRVIDVFVWSRRTPHLPRLLTDLLAALILVAVMLVIAAKLFAIPLAGILTTSGVAVAVLGFALRDMLTSLFAGIALNLERPYRIGDWLEIEPGTVGQVVEVGWLTTRLVTQDRIGLIVPNAQLATRGFSNFDQPPGPWRDHVTVTVGYEVSPERVERILLAAAATITAARADGRKPDARMTACGNHGVVWELRYWIRGYAERVEVRHQVYAAVLHHLYKAGLGPAHHRLDLFHAPMPPRMLQHRTQLDALLARSDLFGMVPPEELRALARTAAQRRVAAGATVVRQGETGNSLFIVVEGVLDVMIDSDPGPPRWVRQLAPGDLFGEYSLLTGAARSATVTARTDSLLFEVTKAGLLPLLERCPELAQNMSCILASRQADRAPSYQPVGEVAPSADEHGLLQRIRAFFSLSNTEH